VGTGLWFAAVTKTVASVIHSRHNLIDWQVARPLWFGSLTSSVLTLVLLQRYAAHHELAGVVKYTVAVAAFVTASGMLFQGPLQALGRLSRRNNRGNFRRLQAPLTVATGAVLGVLVSGRAWRSVSSLPLPGAAHTATLGSDRHRARHPARAVR